MLHNFAWLPWRALTHDASNVRLRGGPGSSLEMPGGPGQVMSTLDQYPPRLLNQVMYPIK